MIKPIIKVTVYIISSKMKKRFCDTKFILTKFKI